MLDQTLFSKPNGGLCGPERRLNDRSAVHLDAVCQTPEGDCAALIISLSRRGAGFISPQPFPQGTTFFLRLANAGRTAWCLCQVRVVHSRPVASGNWIVGAEFLQPLSDAQWAQLRE